MFWVFSARQLVCRRPWSSRRRYSAASLDNILAYDFEVDPWHLVFGDCGTQTSKCEFETCIRKFAINIFDMPQCTIFVTIDVRIYRGAWRPRSSIRKFFDQAGIEVHGRNDCIVYGGVSDLENSFVGDDNFFIPGGESRARWIANRETPKYRSRSAIVVIILLSHRAILRSWRRVNRCRENGKTGSQSNNRESVREVHLGGSRRQCSLKKLRIPTRLWSILYVGIISC